MLKKKIASPFKTLYISYSIVELTCLFVVLFKHLYDKLYNENKISGYCPIFFFGNSLYKKPTIKCSGLFASIFKCNYKTVPHPISHLFVFLNLFIFGLHSYSQCPSGTVPTGTNLIVNGDFSAGNTSFTSAYLYCNSTNCLYPESKYGVGVSALFYHSAFVGHDHTTGTGNFMIVNGAGTPNTSVWIQTISVVPNSDYIFSSWVCSVHPSSPAKLQFSVNGILLGSIFTAPSTINTWINFSATWNSGSNTSAIISIINQNTTASGNDFGLDDIFFQKCCATLTASVGSNVTMCYGQSSTTLTATGSGGTPPYSYSWSNGSTSQSINVGNGTYTVAISGASGCQPANATVVVSTAPAPITVNAGPDKTTCGSSLTLNGTVTGATGGIWSGGNGTYTPGITALNTTYTPTIAELTSGTVVLTLTSTGNGVCSSASDQVVLHVSTPIIVTINSPPVICYGQTATITANVSGGIGPYTYLWNTGQSTQTISNVVAGIHSVTVTGGSPGFCTGTASVTISPNPQIIVSTSQNNATTCNALSAISASATGGTGIYTYLWSNGAATSSTNVNAGTYTITVTDAAHCPSGNSLTVPPINSLAATVSAIRGRSSNC